MFPRLAMFALLLNCLFSQTGCTVMQWTRDTFRQSYQVFEPTSDGYEDATDDSTDKWSFVGKEARGNRPVQKENDPLKPYLMSDKARNIEHNLGVE